MKTESDSRTDVSRTLVIAAFAAIYIVWGSTYLAIRVAVETLPPFLMAAMRFFIAGTILYGWLRLRGVPAPKRMLWRNATITGALMLVGGNGLVVWAEQSLASSLTALLIALTPIWFALLDWARPSGVRPRWRTVTGIMVGLAGVIFLVSGSNTRGAAGASNPWGAVAVIAAGMCWAGGSLFARGKAKTESPWMNAALQMICGGVGLLLVGVVTGETHRTDWHQFSARSVMAFLYLVVFGSWVGFGAYVWLLKVSTPARVATYAYVNPVIAVLLGWGFLGENVTSRMLWASLVIILGVVIITVPPIQGLGGIRAGAVSFGRLWRGTLGRFCFRPGIRRD